MTAAVCPRCGHPLHIRGIDEHESCGGCGASCSVEVVLDPPEPRPGGWWPDPPTEPVP